MKKKEKQTIGLTDRKSIDCGSEKPNKQNNNDTANEKKKKQQHTICVGKVKNSTSSDTLSMPSKN